MFQHIQRGDALQVVVRQRTDRIRLLPLRIRRDNRSQADRFISQRLFYTVAESRVGLRQQNTHLHIRPTGRFVALFLISNRQSGKLFNHLLRRCRLLRNPVQGSKQRDR